MMLKTIPAVAVIIDLFLLCRRCGAEKYRERVVQNSAPKRIGRIVCILTRFRPFGASERLRAWSSGDGDSEGDSRVYFGRPFPYFDCSDSMAPGVN